MSVSNPQSRPFIASASEAQNRMSATGGNSISKSDLPPSNTQRWTIRRKAAVVAGVKAGLITIEEACERYSLTAEEFLSWQRLIEAHGLRGLRVTKIQDYRSRPRRS